MALSKDPKDDLTRQSSLSPMSATGSPRPQPNGSAQYWYETQERAFAPHIADGWPLVIAAPHTPNGRLVRRLGDPSELLAAAKATMEYWEATGFATCEKDCDCVVDAMRAAIAKAEGREC